MPPERQMPLDFDRLLHISIPQAVAWVVLFGVALYHFRMKTLWLLVTAPLALYWPVWLQLNGVPSRYHSGNCV
jgi:hypothetical protein